MKLKKIMAVLLSCFILSGCNDGKKKEQEQIEQAYALNLNTVSSQMLAGAALSESLCNNTTQVWYNAIYDKYNVNTFKFMTDSNDDGKVDFNDAIINLFAHESTISTVNMLKDNKQKVDSLMSELATPPEKYEKCYDTVTDLYKIYSNFTSIAITPTGTYNDYSTNVSKLDSDFGSTYNLLKTQLPDITSIENIE